MYYDIQYKTPVGNVGTHIAVEADTVEEAVKLSPIMLSYGTPWKPEEFTVLSVEESKNKPIQLNGE